MAESIGQHQRRVAMAIDDERQRFGLQPLPPHALTSSPATLLVADVSDTERLTSATITELLTMSRRTGGRLVVRGASTRDLGVIARAGLTIEPRGVAASPLTRRRTPL